MPSQRSTLTTWPVLIAHDESHRSVPPWWIRQIVLWNAERLVGLTATHHCDELAELLGPPPSGGTWPLAQPYRLRPDGSVQGISTCGLVAEGILRVSGCAVPWGNDPYSPGTTIRRLLRWADREHAFAPLSRATPGDVLIWARGTASHAAILVRLTPAQTIDGGQLDAHGLQTIARCDRTELDHHRGIPLHRVVATDALPVLDRGALLRR